MADSEFLKVVFKDLCYLRDKWTGRIDSEEIRATGPILRRLLVDNYLMRAWDEIGLENQSPNFTIVDVDNIAGNFTSDEIEIILSGGAEYKGGSYQAIRLTKGNRILPKTPIITIPLKKFINATCIQIKHIKINNQELIRYFCNKLGAVHYDNSRKNNEIEDKFKLLDHLRKNQTWININFAGLDPVQFQLLSIGQIIIESNDIGVLMDKLEHIDFKGR